MQTPPQYFIESFKPSCFNNIAADTLAALARDLRFTTRPDGPQCPRGIDLNQLISVLNIAAEYSNLHCEGTKIWQKPGPYPTQPEHNYFGQIEKLRLSFMDDRCRKTDTCLHRIGVDSGDFEYGITSTSKSETSRIAFTKLLIGDGVDSVEPFLQIWTMRMNLIDISQGPNAIQEFTEAESAILGLCALLKGPELVVQHHKVSYR